MGIGKIFGGKETKIIVEGGFPDRWTKHNVWIGKVPELTPDINNIDISNVKLELVGRVKSGAFKERKYIEVVKSRRVDAEILGLIPRVLVAEDGRVFSNKAVKEQNLFNNFIDTVKEYGFEKIYSKECF